MRAGSATSIAHRRVVYLASPSSNGISRACCELIWHHRARNVKEYGAETTSAPSSAPQTTQLVTTVTNPFVQAGFFLVPQASFTQSYTQTVTSSRSVQVSNYVKMVTFAGTVSVAVPAGTFQACQFVETGTVAMAGGSPMPTGTTTSWIGVGSGLQIKLQVASTVPGAPISSTFELVSASINRVAVRP